MLGDHAEMTNRLTLARTRALTLARTLSRPLTLTLVLTLPVTPSVAQSLSPEVAAQVRKIIAINPTTNPHVFAKLGGSSVVSRAFLRCFATPYVDLGAHGNLERARASFDQGRYSRNPFTRQSEAAGIGWSLRQALSGIPPRFAREVRQLNPRYALVLFGANDVQSENERVFARRLDKIVHGLIAKGVVPVLGTITPRRNRARDLWVRRFDHVVDAIANTWSLPKIDYGGAMRSLPSHGLARDGVHPNVVGRGGLKNACRFDEYALLFGQNTRNLLTMQMLHALTELSAVDPTGDGPITRTALRPSVASSELPWSGWLDLSVTEPGPSLECGRRTLSSRFASTFNLAEPTRIRASAFGMNGRKPRVAIVRRDETEAPECVTASVQTVNTLLPAGRFEIWVAPSHRSVARGDQILVLVNDGP